MNLIRKLFFWKWTDDEVLANAQQRLKLSRIYIVFMGVMAVLGVVGIGLYFGLAHYFLSDFPESIGGVPPEITVPAAKAIGFFIGIFATCMIAGPFGWIGIWIYQLRVSKLLLKLRDRVNELEARSAHRD